MRLPLSLPLALTLTAISAGLFGMAFPPWGNNALAYIALAPLLLAIRSGGLGRALCLAWIWGSAMSVLIAGEIPAAIARFYGRPMWFGVLAGGVVFTVMSTVYYMLFAAADQALARKPRLWTPFLVGTAWVAAEWGRGQLFTGTAFFIGNPWGLLGYTHASGSLAQMASVTGVYGISFVLAVFNAGLADAGARWLVPRSSPTAERRGGSGTLGLAALPVAVTTLAGGLVLWNAPPLDSLDGDFREVAVAQGNVAIGRRWRAEFYARNLDVYLDLTRRATERKTLHTVIWPEAAMNFFVEREPELREAIAATLRASNAELLAGGPHADGSDTPAFYNSMFQIDGTGQLRGRYDKEYLVPFFEYFPFAGLDLMSRGFEGARTFARGDRRPAPLETRLGRVGMLVCVEAMFPEAARDRVRAGAEVLLSPSNDAWIADGDFAEHMLGVVGMRAIEQRRYLVRASTSGPSAVIDPWGRVLVETDPFRRHLLVGRVEPREQQSIYGRLGDTFAYACITAALLATASSLRGAWPRRSDV